MRHTAIGEKGILGTQPHGETESERVIERTRQDQRIDEGMIGMGEGHAAGVGQFGHFGEPLPLQAHGQCA